MKASIYRPVGVGNVASNMEIKDANGKFNKVVEITPTEWLPMHDGEMVTNAKKMEATTRDVDGNESKSSIITDQVIEATWYPGRSNRLTAPNVRRGEQVEIWAAADSDKYFWRESGTDDHLRKKETIIIGISNTDDEDDTELRPDNMYWIEMSTHSQIISVSTSQSAGEAYQHELFIDAGKSTFTYTDDIGNMIHANSRENLIHLENADGTYVKLTKKDIDGYAPKDIKLKATNNVTIEAGKELMVKGGVKATINGGGSYMEFTAGVTTLKTPHLSGKR